MEQRQNNAADSGTSCQGPIGMLKLVYPEDTSLQSDM